MSEQHSKEIRSIVTSEGNVELSIAVSEIPVPSDDEVLIKVGASPINPSDLALLLSFAADMDTITSTGSGDDTVTTIKIHPAMMGAMKPRLDESMQVGNEGSGVVVDAGVNAKDLIGKTVGLAGGAMYSQYRCVPAMSCLVMEDRHISSRSCVFICEPFNCISFY
jgi:NADPH2:quinone reductase